MVIITGFNFFELQTIPPSPWGDLFQCLFIFERERERGSRGRAESEGDRGSQAGSALSSQSAMWGSNSQNCEIKT